MDGHHRRKRVGGSSSSSIAGSECSLLKLPPCLIMDIIARLPIKTIFNCRCVCKTWRRFISSDPLFVKFQLEKSPTCMLTQNISVENLQLAQIKESKFRVSVDKINFVPGVNLPNPDFEVVNSCNGLLCLADTTEGYYHDRIYVCNPVLGEYIAIPVPNDGTRCRTKFGLGFNPTSNQYKVLQLFYPNTRHPEAQVYTIGTGIWRCIENAVGGLGSLDFNTLLRGSIHWINSEFICAFDFGSERFNQFSLPPDCQVRRYAFKRLGVFKACLSFSFSADCESREFDIWVMKKYGVKESWTKQFVIQNLHFTPCPCNIYEPLIFLSNGKILMLHNYKTVVCYSTKRKHFRDIIVSAAPQGICTIAYSPSFVSLQHIAKEEQVELLRTS